MNQIIQQPEDKFFKQSLSDIPVAKDFFEEHLPKAILKKYRKSRDLEQYLKELLPWLKQIEVYSGLEYAKTTLNLGINIFNKEEIVKC